MADNWLMASPQINMSIGDISAKEILSLYSPSGKSRTFREDIKYYFADFVRKRGNSPPFRTKKLQIWGVPLSPPLRIFPDDDDDDDDDVVLLHLHDVDVNHVWTMWTKDKEWVKIIFEISDTGFI